MPVDKEAVMDKVEETVEVAKHKAKKKAQKAAEGLSKQKSKLRESDIFRKAVKKAFTQCDFDDSGKISGAELYTGILLVYDKVNKLAPVHIKVPKKGDVKAILKRHDIDESGELTEGEFTMVVDELVLGSRKQWYNAIWFRVLSATALKLALFPLAGHGLKKGLSSAGFKPIDKVPTAVLAFATEIGYKVGRMAIADASDD